MTFTFPYNNIIVVIFLQFVGIESTFVLSAIFSAVLAASPLWPLTIWVRIKCVQSEYGSVSTELNIVTNRHMMMMTMMLLLLMIWSKWSEQHTTNKIKQNHRATVEFSNDVTNWISCPHSRTLTLTDRQLPRHIIIGHIPRPSERLAQ